MSVQIQDRTSLRQAAQYPVQHLRVPLHQGIFFQATLGVMTEEVFIVTVSLAKCQYRLCPIFCMIDQTMSGILCQIWNVVIARIQTHL